MNLLVARHEERHRGVCDEVLQFSTSEVWTSKFWKFDSKNVNSIMEVGNDRHGFCGWSSRDLGEVWLYLGNVL